MNGRNCTLGECCVQQDRCTGILQMYTQVCTQGITRIGNFEDCADFNKIYLGS